MEKTEVIELLSAEKIQQRVSEIGRQITADLAGTDQLLVVGVLKGAFMFTADLVRSIQIPCHIEFIRASSYGHSMQSSGNVAISGDLDIENHDVLLVEDIIDTGLTILRIAENFRKKNPASLRICTLLDKPSTRKYPVTVDYSGFSVPDRFVVGYGIDYAEQYRELPFIGTLP
ncbi:MAG: hypoxanthine phosphoribosyltransferase [Chlorobium phaeobacteroides]|nr:hypoxanthine phosphoribosyltransferase [Chlorobium phaeobacteroides]